MAADQVVVSVMDGVIEQLKQQSRRSQYRTNPALWAKDVLGIHLWSKQREVLAELMANDHTAVRSCHGSGKSLLASVIACWWVSVHPEGEAIVVTTAPTYPQVHAILWEEMRKHHITARQRYKEGLSPMPLPGKITMGDKWNSDTGQLLGFGRKPADGNDHGFQGIHRRYVLVLVDESCGIQENLFTAVEAITTTENSKILAIGNPDDPATKFNKFFTDNPSNWAKVDISSFDSPNFTKMHEGHYKGCDDPECLVREWAKRWDMDRDVPDNLLPLLPNHEWVEQRRIEWGEDSPLWLSKVKGEFPLQSVNTLFSRETLNRGHDTVVKPHRNGKLVLGVDLSRFGPDYSVIYSSQPGMVMRETLDKDGQPTGKFEPTGAEGQYVRLVDKWGGKADEVQVDGMESAAKVHQWAQSLGADEVRIDSESLGGPIMDQIIRLSEGAYTVIGIRGNSPSPDRFRWINSRAFNYEKAREAMFTRKIDIDPKDTKLESELEQLQYHFKNQMKSMQIESKEDIAKRNLKSPDFADAFIYATADMSAVINNPAGMYQYGDKLQMSVAEFLGLGEYSISPY